MNHGDGYQDHEEKDTMTKPKRWTHGLPFGETELEGVSRGMSSEAYDYTYPGHDEIPLSHQRGARKERRQRIKRRLEREGGFP